MLKKITLINFILIAFLLVASSGAEAKKSFTMKDVMSFKSIKNQKISDNGKWIAFTSAPDRGNSEAVIQSTEDDTLVYRYDRGSRPILTSDGNWAAFTMNPDVVEKENDKDKKLKKGLGLLNTASGKYFEFDDISRYKFSNNSKWLVFKHGKNKSVKDKNAGTKLTLRNLAEEADLQFDFVTDYQFDSTGKYFAFTVREPDKKRNGVYVIDLDGTFQLPKKVYGDEKGVYSSLSWSDRSGLLGFVAGLEAGKTKVDSLSLMIWSQMGKEMKEAVNFTETADDWYIPTKNKLQWTDDERRLFFGLRLEKYNKEDEEDYVYTDSSFYEFDAIREKTELDIWHWNDDRIKPNQKKWWSNNSERTYLAVYDLNTDKFKQLADLDMPDVLFADNPYYTIGMNTTPYLKETTWDGWYFDLYKVDLRKGTRKMISEKAPAYYGGSYSLSPNGDFIAYFKDSTWFLHNTRIDTTINFTGRYPISFCDEDWDQPAEAIPYGLGGWTENDNFLFIYAKYDVWKFSTRAFNGIAQTGADGVINKIKFRLVNLDPDKKFYAQRDKILMTGFWEETKKKGLYEIELGVIGPKRLMEIEGRLNPIAKAKNADKILFSEEHYNIFPDLYIADPQFQVVKKLTDENPTMKDYNWGTTHLTKWKSFEGDSLQGFYILPDNFKKGKKYPMLIYFYERFSDYATRFFQPKINHRPVFPVYTGKDYVIFLPDIKYKGGNPGINSLNCIVPGIRHLAEMGIVDTTKIGIQGHSWAGYQTAFLVTQTDLFGAAIAGAPVGNMTSAYSGIRLGTGLARQFQYEKTQSRIGGTLWDSLDNYIRNSPIFYAPQANTPLMIMFGDQDEAVPWEQGIEIYLAWRRLGKNCIFLQYHKEPHHPRKYWNKLDYSIKMMEFYDHYLLGMPAAEWITVGKEYEGK
jgi:Prolyl oligopeptidase family